MLDVIEGVSPWESDQRLRTGLMVNSLGSRADWRQRPPVSSTMPLPLWCRRYPCFEITCDLSDFLTFEYLRKETIGTPSDHLSVARNNILHSGCYPLSV